jgi:hypothetical protein
MNEQREGMMAIQCAGCGKEIEKSRIYEHLGNPYCEDCYMDIRSPSKACDPWAVHSAKTFLKGKDKRSALTPQQLKLVHYIEAKKEATVEEILEGLDLPENEFRREFAVLRHMEILGATRKDGKILYSLFQDGK